MKDVVLVGEGAMAVALSHALHRGGRAVGLVVQQTEHGNMVMHTRENRTALPGAVLDRAIDITFDIERVREGALVVIAVPSRDFAAVSRQVGSVIDPEQVVLSATKGFDPATLDTFSNCLSATTGARAVGAIGGPNMMTDIAAGSLTALVVATTEAGSTKFAAQMLATERLIVRPVEDLRGLELFAALKNMVVLAMGISSGLGLGSNAVALALVRGLEEITNLAESLGADPATATGLGGIGDIYLTCSSASGLNYRVGVALGAGTPLNECLAPLPATPESVATARACAQILKSARMPSPLLEAVSTVVDGGDPRALEEVLLKL